MREQMRTQAVEVGEHGLKKHDIRVSTVVFMIFCLVAAGCYGIEEMIPEWFEIENVPFDKMLPDDKEWFPIVVAGENVYGTVFLEEDLKHSINNFKVVSKDELESQIQNLYGSSEASEIAK